jgi:hypothetical protein
MTRKLMLVALIALVLCTAFGAKASCTTPPTEWRLTINTTEGGRIISPGIGAHFYDAGEVVVLVAAPHAGYRFVNWTGKVRSIEDVNAAKTRIVMDLDYTITANFAPVPAG